MTGNDSKSYHFYLNKFVDQNSNTAHHFINEKYINSDYSASTKNIEWNPKAPKFKVNGAVRITKYKNIYSIGKYLLSNLFWKLILEVKVALGLSNYATKKELDHAAGIDTSGLI